MIVSDLEVFTSMGESCVKPQLSYALQGLSSSCPPKAPTSGACWAFAIIWDTFTKTGVQEDKSAARLAMECWGLVKPATSPLFFLMWIDAQHLLQSRS